MKNNIRVSETGQRGYLLTGDEALLKPCLAVRDGIKMRASTMQTTSTSRFFRRAGDNLLNLISDPFRLQQVGKLSGNDIKIAESGAVATNPDGREPANCLSDLATRLPRYLECALLSPAKMNESAH